jgi:hypothetical protein
VDAGRGRAGAKFCPLFLQDVKQIKTVRGFRGTARTDFINYRILNAKTFGANGEQNMANPSSPNPEIY